MTVDQIKAALRAQPFRPFHIRTSDGQEYEVRHPEMAAMLKGMERTLFVALPGQDAAAVIDLLHVTAITFDNGKGRPRRRAG